jgi:diacylglycerol kinase (ATP)
MHSSYKSKGGPARRYNALRYSIQGFVAAFRHEAAFRQELLLVAVLAPLAVWLGRSPVEIAMLVGVLLIVLIVELLNSALEALADTITVDPHPMIGRAKDLGSAAVLLSLVVAALVWVGVLASHLLPA